MLNDDLKLKYVLFHKTNKIGRHFMFKKYDLRLLEAKGVSNNRYIN